MVSNRDIEATARNFLDKRGILSAPVPVEDLAWQEDIQVVRSPASGGESAFLMRSAQATIIGINSLTSRRRQRFSIAHELGHWFLHDGRPLIVDHSIRINKRDQVSSAATDHEEIEANAFAAALLMPAHLVQRAVDREQEFGIDSRDTLVQSLAKEFDVSTEAMGYRLINLGVFSS